MYGLGAQPAQMGAFVYTDKSKGEGYGVYFRLVPGTSTPKVSVRCVFPDDNKPNCRWSFLSDATVGELICYVAAKRHIPSIL